MNTNKEQKCNYVGDDCYCSICDTPLKRRIDLDRELDSYTNNCIRLAIEAERESLREKIKGLNTLEIDEYSLIKKEQVLKLLE